MRVPEIQLRMVQSLGPVLSERAEALGNDQFFLALTYQRYSFDRIDDLDLRGFSVAIPLELPTPAGSLPALVTVHLTFSQMTTHFIYGVAPSVDVSFALPLVNSRVTVSTQPGIQKTLRGLDDLCGERGHRHRGGSSHNTQFNSSPSRVRRPSSVRTHGRTCQGGSCRTC